MMLLTATLIVREIACYLRASYNAQVSSLLSSPCCLLPPKFRVPQFRATNVLPQACALMLVGHGMYGLFPGPLSVESANFFQGLHLNRAREVLVSTHSGT